MCHAKKGWAWSWLYEQSSMMLGPPWLMKYTGVRPIDTFAAVFVNVCPRRC